MRIRRLLPTVLIFLAVAALPSLAQISDTAKTERRDSKATQRQLHSRSTLDRADGMRQLATFPPLEGARLAVQIGLTDADADVRCAAYETLLGWKDDAQVGDFLLKSLKRDNTTKKSGIPTAVPVLAILLASDLPETQQRLRKFLDTWLAKSKEAAPILGTVADELGLRADLQSFATLKKLTEQKWFNDFFACRRAVIQAMIRLRTTESLAALIVLLPKIDGEVRGDIVRYLEDISHENFGCDAKVWQAWWEKHAEGFKFPDGALATAGAGVAVQGGRSYYGLPLNARRVVFVVDISGSMTGQRLAAAKRELTGAISGMPEDTQLGLVAFSTRVVPWRPELAAATPANKQNALRFVNQLMARGRTATYDALEAAFCYDAEAIYLLSDGAPNHGKVVDPVQIITAITAANRGRRVSIYTIGIAPGTAEGANETFMKTLAEQNFALYKRVDE